MVHKKNKKEQNEVDQMHMNNENIEAVTYEMSEEVHKQKKSKKKKQQLEQQPLTEPIKETLEENYVVEKKKKGKKKKKDIEIKSEVSDAGQNETQNNTVCTNEILNHINDSNINNETKDDSNISNKTKHRDYDLELVKTETSVLQPSEQQQQELQNSVKREKPNKNRKNNNNEEEKVIDWPEKDLTELFKRMEAAVPEKDTFAYSTRVEKLNWDEVAFNSFTGEECKSTWQLVQKRLRRFRLLNELLQDAKEWTSKPWTNFYGSQKTKRHPDMPRRPLSTYMLFYVHKKDKIIAENPGLEMTEVSKIITQMYKQLLPNKKDKYAKEAAEKKRLYELELEEFYRLHPQIARTVEKVATQKPVVEPGPKKPNTPFALYFQSQLKSIDPNIPIDKHTFKEQIKEQWKNMSEKKKVIWINWAADEEIKYQDDLKNYMSQNPDYVPATLKPVLTKEEKVIRERMSGKPMKPPNSAYSLFSRMVLKSEDIKQVTPKDRMVVIAEKWKNCTEDERKQYNEKMLHLRAQYKLDFATYLESLPEDKREEEIRSTLPKRKRTVSKSEEKDTKDVKKKKIEAENNAVTPDDDKSKVTKTDEIPKNKKIEIKKEIKEEEKDDKDELSPFARPKYWSRMKRAEKRTFKNAMLKLKTHLDSRFEKYISSRGSDNSEEESDSEDSDESSSSSS